jgi:hypothetical protein
VLANRLYQPPNGITERSFELSCGERLLAPASGQATILDDDPAGLWVGDASVVEPSTGTVDAVFTVGLGPAAAAPVTVSYSTADGSALAGADYVAESGLVTLDPGLLSATVRIPVQADGAAEEDEAFFLDLSSASGASIVRARGTARIFERGFHPLSPCRLLDSREDDAGPSLENTQPRTVALAGRCGMPASATAVSLNVTVTNPGGAGHIALYGGAGSPQTSAINYAAGQTRANNAVVSPDRNGRITLRAIQGTGSVDVVLDANGYFQ